MDMPSTQSLKRMYNTLVQYKYKFPNQPGPVPGQIPDPFIINVEKQIRDLFPGINTQSQQFNSADLISIMENVPNKPILPDGYHYRYQLLNIGFWVLDNVGLNQQFNIDWYSNLIQGVLTLNNVSIFMKTIDTAMLMTPYGELYVSPGENNIIYQRAYVSSGGAVYINHPNVSSNDPDPTDQHNYPYIDTEAGENDLYYGYLQINPTNSFPTSGVTFYLYVMCVPVENQN